MNTFWLKVAVICILIIASIMVLNYFGFNYEYLRARLNESKQPEKDLGDQFREDEKRLRAEPNVVQTTSQPVAKQQKPLTFKELTEEERAGAEQLFEWAIKCREMGRLPGMGYGRMVDACRDIIQKYPGSEFDYKARRMLGEVPQREWDRYKITEQEINPAK